VVITTQNRLKVTSRQVCEYALFAGVSRELVFWPRTVRVGNALRRRTETFIIECIDYGLLLITQLGGVCRWHSQRP
jgi:hypothetical protein